MRSGESSIEQRPDTRIYAAQRISDGMKECEGEGSKRKSEAVVKECRTSEGQTDMMDNRCLHLQFVFNSLFNRKPMKSVKDGRYMIKLRSSTDEPCSVVPNFLKFVNTAVQNVFNITYHNLLGHKIVMFCEE